MFGGKTLGISRRECGAGVEQGAVDNPTPGWQLTQSDDQT